MKHPDAPLSDLAAQIMLSTRCLGRATSFPHTLMQAVLRALDENSVYALVIEELRSRQFIVAAGTIGFDISRAGWDWLGYRQVNADIWFATMIGLVKTVPDCRAADAREDLELLLIHAAALANSIYERDKELHIRLMSLSVECQIHLGHLEEAQLRLQQLNQLAASIKKSPS